MTIIIEFKNYYLNYENTNLTIRNQNKLLFQIKNYNRLKSNYLLGILFLLTLSVNEESNI